MPTPVLTQAEYIALRRVHVNDAAMWGVQAGTDFWLNASGLQLTAGRTLITDGGWTATSLSLVAGSAADFMTKDDVGIPGHFLQNAGADLLQSPAIFGDYTHARQAMEIIGLPTLPQYLVADFFAAFATSSANEVTTNIGFVEDGGSIVVAADIQASFYSDSALFSSQSNAAVLAGTTTVDTAWHNFRIVLDRALAKSFYYVDGILQNVGLAITNDEFPVSFGAGSGTTNRPLLNRAHIWYAWAKPAIATV